MRNAALSEVRDAAERNSSVAAFFDLDGTLLPLPSLERRLWKMLRFRKQIGASNYLATLREALRLLPRGIGPMLHANKAYLRGVSISECAMVAIPAFFPEALQRVRWHAERGHRIVIVSGTLEPLALRTAHALEAELAARGVPARLEVSATRLERIAHAWTGRLLGEAMFGEAKARAVRRFCSPCGIDAAKCFAYGDSANDRGMLEAVGRPAAVNPSDDLARIARRNGWPALCWHEQRVPPQGAQSPPGDESNAATSWNARDSRSAPQVAAIKRECCR